MADGRQDVLYFWEAHLVELQEEAAQLVHCSGKLPSCGNVLCHIQQD